MVLEQVAGAAAPCHLASLQAHDVIDDTEKARTGRMRALRRKRTRSITAAGPFFSRVATRS